MRDGDYILFFDSNHSYADAYYPNVQTYAHAGRVTITKGQDSQIVMEMDPGGELEVQIIDIDTGQIASNGSVELLREDGSYYYNLAYPETENKAVLIQGLADGTYYLKANAPGYVSEYFAQSDSYFEAIPIQVSGGEKVAMQVPLQKTTSLNIIFPTDEVDRNELSSRYLRVYQVDDACGGRAWVKGEYIYAMSSSADAELNVTIDGLNPNATYEVEVEHLSYQDFGVDPISNIQLDRSATTSVTANVYLGSSLSGTVVDRNTSLGILSTVDLFKQSTTNTSDFVKIATLYTDSDGAYNFRGLKDGIYYLHVNTWAFFQSSNYAPINSELIVLPPAGDVVINLEADAGGEIKGGVSFDSYVSTGAVELYQKQGGEYVYVTQSSTIDTDSLDFHLKGLAPGRYYLKARATNSAWNGEKLKDTWYGNVDNPDDSTPVDVVAGEAVEGILINVERGGALRGTIQQPNVYLGPEIYNGPFPAVDYYNSVRVYQEDGTFVTQKSVIEGDLKVDGLWPGTYYLLFESLDYKGLSLCGTYTFYGEWYGGASRIEDATPIIITGTEVIEGINGELSADNLPPVLPDAPPSADAYKVTGRVTENGASLANVKITADNGQSTLTDGAGNYVLYLTPGEHTIIATKLGFSFTPSPLDVSVADADVNGQNFTATELPKGSISGTVIEDESNAPLSNIDVLAYAQNGDAWQFAQIATTDDNGNYELEGLSPADYKLLFRTRLQTHKSEYYNDAENFLQGNALTVESGQALTDIDVSLEQRPEAAIVATGIDSYTDPDTG
ncbi:MAG: carboxypeptidase regulatory-like domain-containing protein, partial [Chloroflexota bacterium]